MTHILLGQDKRLEQMSFESQDFYPPGYGPRVHITNMHSTLVWTYLKQNWTEWLQKWYQLTTDPRNCAWSLFSKRGPKEKGLAPFSKEGGPDKQTKRGMKETGTVKFLQANKKVA